MTDIAEIELSGLRGWRHGNVLLFNIPSSNPTAEPYAVYAVFRPLSFTVLCSCKGHRYRWKCRHQKLVEDAITSTPIFSDLKTAEQS